MIDARIIVAYAKNNRVIGKGGKLPWHLPEDMKHFKETTGFDPVIMGRKTYDSIPEKFRPLPNRMNLVVSRTQKTNELFFDPKAPQYVSSINRALELIDLTVPGATVWIIGGGEIYQQALDANLITEIWASEVSGDFEGDTFFPELVGWTGETVKSYNGFDVVRYRRDSDEAN